MKYDGDDLNANKSDDDTDFYKKATGKDALTGNGVVTEVFVGRHRQDRGRGYH